TPKQGSWRPKDSIRVTPSTCGTSSTGRIGPCASGPSSGLGREHGRAAGSAAKSPRSTISKDSSRLGCGSLSSKSRVHLAVGASLGRAPHVEEPGSAAANEGYPGGPRLYLPRAIQRLTERIRR